MNTVLPNGWKVEHVHSDESLSQEFPVATQCNYHSLEKSEIYYWETESRMKENVTYYDVAIFRLKPKKA